jgi:UDP-N-acetylglucosamine 2-epimerase (non-hydrolysing)
MKTIVTVTGIRPDFIRMSEIFKKLDANFNHILIHTGQHFDKLLSEVFFQQLNIREPNYNLAIGGYGKEHFHQSADLSVRLIELFRKENIKPDIILFLGDSNSVCVAVQLKKEGYCIGHIEAGMRSYDKRMLEEINRIVCDHCSDYLFVYHENYKQKLIKEGISEDKIFVVGNTIVEVANKFIPNIPKRNDAILLDIHRPENFQYKNRLKNILEYSQQCAEKYSLPIRFLNFARTMQSINNYEIDLANFPNITISPLLSFTQYLDTIYHCKFIISDSGTAQEEPCLLNTPVIVPRDFTERPESVINNCSFMLNVNNTKDETWQQSYNWLQYKYANKDISWLGTGNTSQLIIDKLKSVLC